MTTYEFIKHQKEAGLWDGCQVLFARAETLDLYFRIYSLILQLEPQRKYGYIKRALYNPLISRLIPPHIIGT